MIFSAGDSRTSSMSALYASPSTSTRDPRTLRSTPFRARAILAPQKYGMFSFTLPASSMNSV